MQYNDHNPRNRIVQTLAAAAVLTAIGLTLTPAPAVAKPSTMVTHEFYADDSYSESVGVRIVNSCYGVVNKVYGEVTPYVREEKTSCNDPKPPQFKFWYCPDYGCESDGQGGLTCTLGSCVLY